MKRALDFRYVIVRNGADYSTICPIKSTSIKCNRNSRIKMSFTGTFRLNSKVNWLTDSIRPEIIIDGIPHSLGLFLPATVRFEHTDTQELVAVEAYDRCWQVMDNYTDSLLYFTAGTNYLEPVKLLLAAAGIAIVAETPTAATLATDRQDWPVGTSYIDIINQLLTEINYHELWFNADGAAVLEPVTTPTAQNIDHTFDTNNVKCLILPNRSRQTDIYTAPNVFIVICSNADNDAPMVARSENTNPQSPLSIARRGRPIATVIQVDNIADQAELQAYADTLRNNSMFSGETIAMKTGLLPGFGVYDVVGLINDDVMDVCIETAWQMKLEVGGEMSHTLERVVVNLG